MPRTLSPGPAQAGGKARPRAQGRRPAQPAPAGPAGVGGRVPWPWRAPAGGRDGDDGRGQTGPGTGRAAGRCGGRHRSQGMKPDTQAMTPDTVRTDSAVETRIEAETRAGATP